MLRAVVFLLFFVGLRGAVGTIPYPDFKSSILLKDFDHRYFEYEEKYRSLDQKLVDLFRGIYERNIEVAKNDKSNRVDRIPRIIHQIWLGGPIPEKYHTWMSTCTRHGWECRLWTDEDVEQMTLYNRELYDSVVNPAEKSDILRLEILHRYGGVYLDTDFEILRPEIFEELHRNFDFYVGVEPLLHGVIYKHHIFKFCNAVIGAAPNHSLVWDLIENMKANYLAYLTVGVVERTGPSYLTRIICEYEMRHAHKQRNMYLPCTFFYPFSICETGEFLDHPEKIFDAFPETAGIHYWIGSWRDAECSYAENPKKANL